MKLGCCLNMLGTPENIIGSKYLSVIAKAGYDYAELPLAQIMELTDFEFNNLQKALVQQRLTCRCCNNFFPAFIRLTGEQTDPEKIKDYIKAAIKRASAIGAAYIVFGSSGAKNVPDGFEKNRAFDQITEVLKQAGYYADKAGITIVIEPLNRMESNIILNLEEGIQLLQKVNMPSVQLLVDYYHFQKEHETMETLHKAMPYIQHVHFAEPEGRLFPIKKKEEYAIFFDILKTYGYSGGISIEAYSSEPDREIETAVLIRDYFS